MVGLCLIQVFAHPLALVFFSFQHPSYGGGPRVIASNQAQSMLHPTTCSQQLAPCILLRLWLTVLLCNAWRLTPNPFPHHAKLDPHLNFDQHLAITTPPHFYKPVCQPNPPFSSPPLAYLPANTLSSSPHLAFSPRSLLIALSYIVLWQRSHLYSVLVHYCLMAAFAFA